LTKHGAASYNPCVENLNWKRLMERQTFRNNSDLQLGADLERRVEELARVRGGLRGLHDPVPVDFLHERFEVLRRHTAP
jgi:hypothetical protein